MAPSKVIRIDEQVWEELQKLARPLEDTPNSVLRRVFGLREEAVETDGLDVRIARLLGMVQASVGVAPRVCRARKNYSFLSKADEVVAYIRPQQQKLRIAAGKDTAEAASLAGWDTERNDGFFGGPSVRWSVWDGDDAGYRQAVELLAKLWWTDSRPLEPSIPGWSPPQPPVKNIYPGDLPGN